MSREQGPQSNDALLANAPFLREFLAGNVHAENHYLTLYTEVAKAAGCGTRGQFNSEYVERRYADMAYDGLFPHDHNATLRDILILIPVFAGYELHNPEAIRVFTQDVMDRTFSESQIVIPEGREEDAQLWIVQQMQYGSKLYRATHIVGDDPRLDIFRDFVNSLNISDL